MSVKVVWEKFKTEFKIKMAKEFLKRIGSDPKFAKADFTFEKKTGKRHFLRLCKGFPS